ncbi:MAG: hypothetical protein LBK45_00920 [Tannerellaceae bacterium]|jgi:hypothetical protein|nr:hypothetical protein [Tannerellaceae bacterium]
MRLFKFGKYKSEASSNTTKEPEIERPLNIETPVMPPAQEVIPEPLPSPFPPEKEKEKEKEKEREKEKEPEKEKKKEPEKEKKKEKEMEKKREKEPEKAVEDIADFFSVNIYDIFKHNPKSVRRGKGANGHPMELFALELPKLELSTFFRVLILQYENKRYDLVFISNTNEASDSLKKFIDFSCKAFGPDFMRKGSFNANDIRDAALGVFSRIWYNKARIENASLTLTLTLYGITPGE